MVAARIPSTTTAAARLIALYRAEAKFWDPREMIATFHETCPNTEVCATFFTRMDAPDCSSREIAEHAEAAIRTMVERGHAAEVKAFIDHQATGRARSEARLKTESVRARLRAGVNRLAEQPDGGPALELIARVVEGLTAQTPLAAEARAELVGHLLAALPNRKPARRAIAHVQAALARKGAA